MARNPLEYRPVEYGTMYGEYIPEAEKLLGTNRIPYIYDFHCAKACSATAVELVTNTTDYTVHAAGTYKKVVVDSTSTDDNSSGSACAVALKAWGIDSAKNMRVQSITLSGLTVSSTGTCAMYAVNTLYVGTYGTSNQSCKGSCWAAMIGKNSQKVVTIKALTNHSDNAKFWIPPGWRAKILSVHAFFDTDAKHSCQAAIFPQYYDIYANDDYAGSHDRIVFGIGGGNYGPNSFHRTYGNDTTMSKLSFYGINLSGTENLATQVRVMLWAEPSALLSTQSKYMVGV